LSFNVPTNRETFLTLLSSKQRRQGFDNWHIGCTRRERIRITVTAKGHDQELELKDTRIVPVRRLKISLSILSLIALATLLYVAAETEEIAPLARAHLERAESTLRAFDVPVEARIRQDRSIAGGILAEAKADSHDIIVIGRREPSPLSLFGIDEITRQVLSESDRPVLFVPGRED